MVMCCDCFRSMPLLWKKRQQKAPPSITASSTQSQQNGPPSTITAQNGQADKTQNGQPLDTDVIFVLVMQDFNASIEDELTVTRGQIVQPLSNDGTWLYVKNVDGKCGYIPANFCCPMDQIKDSSHWHNKETHTQRDRTKKMGATSIHNVLQPKLNPSSAFPYSSLPTSPNLTHLSSLQSSPQNPRFLETPSSDPVTPCDFNRKVSEISGIIELSSSPRTNCIVPRLHPLHPLSLTQYNESLTSDRIHKFDTDSIPPSTPAAQPLSVHFRTRSYQEAVKTEENGEVVPPTIEIERPSRPSDLPLVQTHSDGYPKEMLTTTTTGVRTYSQDSQLVDDVFLPSTNKPLGIYRCLTKYDKTVPGEVSLQENEYLIFTEIGQSEWAWVITASGAEGVVPRDILARYNPTESMISEGTQTELIIMAPASTISSSSSTSSRRTSRQESEVVCIREARQSRLSGQRSRTVETAVQTELPSPYIMDAWMSQSQTIDDLWYENSMSIPQLTGLGLNRNESPSICTLPTINGLNYEHGMAPLAFHASRQSLPQFPNPLGLHPVRHRPSIRPMSSVTPVDHTQPIQTLQTRELHEWPISPGVISNFSDASVSIKPQMAVLTAVKNFSPDVDGTNYLALTKGDILYLYPSNNITQKEWLWAYHVKQGTYGFVPKSHTSYVYMTNRRQKHNGITRYDEV